MVDDAGHSAKEPGIRKLLVEVRVSTAGDGDVLIFRLPPNSPVYKEASRTLNVMHD